MRFLTKKKYKQIAIATNTYLSSLQLAIFYSELFFVLLLGLFLIDVDTTIVKQMRLNH